MGTSDSKSLSIKHHELIENAEDLVLELSETDREDKEAIAKAVAKFLDTIVPLDILIPGPIGQLAEKVDYNAFEFLIQHLVKVFHVDPVKKAERQLRRQQRREERQQRREAKRRKKIQKEKDNA
jgi:hypothetical protein